VHFELEPHGAEHDPAMAKMAGNYLNGQLIKMEALANGFAEAIALGPDGRLSEGSGQNVSSFRAASSTRRRSTARCWPALRETAW